MIRIPSFAVVPVALLAFAACETETQSSADDASTQAADGADTFDVADGGAGDDASDGPEMRAVGARAPRTAACDDADPGLCLLPWPSNTFTVLDPSTETGIRLAVDGASLPDVDQPDALNRADGYSRLTPLVTTFPRPVDPASLFGSDDRPVIKLLVAEGDEFGSEEPLRCDHFRDGKKPHQSVVVCYPERPLNPATEHLVVVLDEVRFEDGSEVPAERTALIALGLLAPEAGTEDAELYAYHAPARAALAAAGIEADSVLRLWDFTTRSREDPLWPLRAIREAQVGAVDAGEYQIELDEVKLSSLPSAEIIVQGRLTGLPSFFDLETGALALGEQGQLMETGTWEAPFRAVVPAGDGDYPVVVFCHGTGYHVGDGNFDGLVTEHGALKIGMEVMGWTDVTIMDTVGSLVTPLTGTPVVAAQNLHSIAGGCAFLRALEGKLGDLLAAGSIDGIANPAAGRRPDTTQPIWAAGSLGGVTGLVYIHLEPAIIGGVLNVPGAGFTHWLPASDFEALIEIGLGNNYEGAAARKLAFAMAQTLFDPMDGGVWVDSATQDPVILVQTSVGDPVVANIGSDLLASAVDAVHVGAVLYPVFGVEPVEKAVGRSALTQFKVANEGSYQVHGFTNFESIAGLAARQQLIDFIHSLWEGAPLIEVPTNCLENTPPGSCDFEAVMSGE